MPWTTRSGTTSNMCARHDPPYSRPLGPLIEGWDTTCPSRHGQAHMVLLLLTPAVRRRSDGPRRIIRQGATVRSCWLLGYRRGCRGIAPVWRRGPGVRHGYRLRGQRRHRRRHDRSGPLGRRMRHRHRLGPLWGRPRHRDRSGPLWRGLRHRDPNAAAGLRVRRARLWIAWPGAVVHSGADGAQVGRIAVLDGPAGGYQQP
jgi:hypothetical protein